MSEARERCRECRAAIRTPATKEARQELWLLCRTSTSNLPASAARLMCPYFTPDDPCNGGWESEARYKFRRLELL